MADRLAASATPAARGPGAVVATAPPAARRGAGAVVVTGAAALSAYGRGTEALLAGGLTGRPAFAPVRRFDIEGRRATAAATMPGSPDLLAELSRVAREACEEAGLSAAARARTPLYVAIHGAPPIARAPAAGRPGHGPDAFTAAVAARCGLADQPRCYMSACVAASTAIGDAAATIARGQADRVLVAGGYLVGTGQLGLFDAGRGLDDDGPVG